ncbi:hypothetical protein GNP82_09710 [Aliivibrio fischeri]|uniref:PP_RS20740 family protein n=1 Tax=Aliivibrio fischeri TaxID=668 RepID=UPI0012D97060|nr:hypothetical protein [Aliivibrio fischeri]MUK37827.1 hypothetical protein [Aliivibrio fischeri]MUL07086.1 hypothetical protein [Aliivibrio fischeri]
MNLFDSDDSLIDDEVFGSVSQSLSQDFKPWHKPRKQFIRDKQWLEQFKRLLGSSKYRSIDTVNYFGLPGGDLLDINYLYEGMLNSSRGGSKRLGFHGFINSSTDFNKAQGELSKILDKDRIEGRSVVERFRFEDLQKTNSDAWVRVKNFGDYHFINLDFCNNVMSHETLVSIYNLLQHQMKKVIGIPWLFCLTTRLNRDSTTEAIVSRFRDIITESLGAQQLNEKIEECFSEVHNYFSNRETGGDIGGVEDDTLMNQILQICLVLWILKEATGRNFNVALKSSMKYSVDLFSRESDMHSFVFSFEKEEEFTSDLLGLSEGNESVVNEVNFDTIATPALERLSNSADVDDILEQDKESLNSYADDMIRWLGRCGYDTSNYKDIMSTNYGYNFD